MALTATFTADVSQFEKAVGKGIEASKGFDTSVKKTQGGLDEFSGVLKKIGPAIAGAFTVGAVVNAVSAFTEFTSKLSDLSAKTGISTSGLQKLQQAFAQSGVSIDTVTNAVTKLGQKLVGDDKAATNAMRALGLSVEELKRLGPEQAFIKTADAVAGVENPMERARLAMDLFGRGGAEVLAGLDGHLAETTAAFDRMGLILSDDVVKAGDKFGDTLTVLKAQGMAMLGQMLAPMLPALTKLAQGFGAMAQTVVPALGAAFKAITVTGLELQVWFFDFMASLAEAGSRVPLLGKALGATSDAAKLFTDKAIAARQEIESWNKEVPKAEVATRKMPIALDGYGDALKRTEDANKKAAAEALKHAEAIKAFQASVDFFGTRLDAFNYNSLQPYAASLSDATAKADIAAATLPVLASTTETAARAMDEAWRATGKFAEAASTASQTVKSSFVSALEGIPNLIVAAFTGGGNVLKAIGSSLGVALGNDLVENFGSTISSTLPKWLGNAINSIIPGVGALLGPLLGKIGGFFKSLFGGIPEDVKKARTEVEAFQAKLAATLTTTQKLEAGNERWKQTVIAVRDAYIKAGLSAADAERIVRQLWDTDRPDKAREAIEEIERVLGLVNDEQEALNEAVERYGFSLEELGPTLQKQRLSEMAQQLNRDFELLTKSGIDVGTVTERMADEINEYLRLALKTGQEVPASMRPMLEKMIEMGLLTDESGNKLTDLSKLKWAETMRESTDRVVGAIDRLGDILQDVFIKAGKGASDFVDGVLDDIDRIPRHITFDVEGNYTPPDMGGAQNSRAASRAGGIGSAINAASAAAPVQVQVFVAVDPQSGRVRVLSNNERQTVQQWLNTGQLTVPQRVVSR